MRNRPGAITAGLCVAAVVSAVGAAVTHTHPWQTLVVSDHGLLLALYMGLAGGAAAVAGFAGVIVIFGLESHSERFLRFRQGSGRSLRSNWRSVVGSSFASAGLAFAAALLVLLGHAGSAPWLMELSVLLLAHAIVRLLWLLSLLMKVVASDDDSASRRRATVPLGAIPGLRRDGSR